MPCSRMIINCFSISESSLCNIILITLNFNLFITNFFLCPIWWQQWHYEVRLHDVVTFYIHGIKTSHHSINWADFCCCCKVLLDCISINILWPISTCKVGTCSKYFLLHKLRDFFQHTKKYSQKQQLKWFPR